jgi:hypothetical protein
MERVMARGWEKVQRELIIKVKGKVAPVLN